MDADDAIVTSIDLEVSRVPCQLGSERAAAHIIERVSRRAVCV
jgi:hypothetical protein